MALSIAQAPWPGVVILVAIKLGISCCTSLAGAQSLLAQQPKRVTYAHRLVCALPPPCRSSRQEADRLPVHCECSPLSESCQKCKATNFWPARDIWDGRTTWQ
jgi:hypothetical protein